MAAPVAALLLVTAGLTGCKPKQDTSKFQEVCARVVKCDKTFQEASKKMAIYLQMSGKTAEGGGDLSSVCTKLLSGLHKNKQAKAFAPQMMACLQNTKCEELAFTGCFTSMMGPNSQPLQFK